MKQKTIPQGFTLIELLVVVAIIGLLAALLFPAVSGVLKKGKTTTAQTEVKSIQTAITAYLNDYGKFPLQANAGSDIIYAGAQYNQLILALRGLDVGITPNPNPRKITYLEVAERSIKGGSMVDPWEKPYNVVVDSNFDKQIRADLPAGQTNFVGRSVLVWSTGAPDDPAVIGSW
jgi:prepilin-type N-terminal cleavage/methylation domain-containing protein